MNRWLQRGLQCSPLIGVAWLLRLLPAIAETPLAGVRVLPWRLDALTLAFLLVPAIGFAVVPLRWRDTLRGLLIFALPAPALLLEHILALPLALLIAGACVQSRRWIVAAAGLVIAFGWLYLTIGASWYDPQVAAGLSAPIFLLIMLACYVGINGYPIARLHENFNPLRLAFQPLWLLPLLRMIAWGPWNSGWALALIVLGGATTLWASTGALWIDDERVCSARVALAWLSSALTGIGLLSTVGIAAALWQLLAYALGLGLLLRRDRLRWWAAPIPLNAGFVAAWLALGAAAAGGVWLLAATIWLSSLLSGIAIFRLPRAQQIDVTDESQRPRSAWPARVLTSASLALGILAPLPLRRLIVPAVDLVQGGLTPFGLLDIWPWVGMAALDAGQRRVAVLPSIAVFVLALVIAALVWIVARLLPSGAPLMPSRAAQTWADVRQRVWWARGTRRRG